MLRLFFAGALVLWAGTATAQDRFQANDSTFERFLNELWPDAQAGGITRATFDTAFAGVTPDPRVMALTRKQPEYGRPAGAYIDLLASRSRVETGARKTVEWAGTVAAIEKTFGVDPRIIIAIWGIETNYGSVEIPWDVIRSIATLAHGGYRTPYFRKELLVALKILQDGHISRNKLLGSWAGAMGQPQFMPSSFINYAVDFSGDGRNDIWTNVPDVLASVANYLQKFGWKTDLPWGFEITIPSEFDYRRSRASFAEWTALGVVRADGGALATTGDAILFFPSGASGPAFLITTNFVVIKRYNNSDLYALAVAHLSDRIGGLAPIRANWPTDDRQLSRDQRIALQKRLAELGYAVRDFEGRFDFDLRDFIRQVQIKFGMVPDGHPTAALLERLEVR